MIDATHLSEIINQPLKPSSQPFLKDGFSIFELGNPSPHMEKLKALKELRLERLKKAFAASDFLEQFSPEKVKAKAPPPPTAKNDQPYPDTSDALVQETYRINNLPNLSPQVFEVLAKALLKFHKPKIKIEEISSDSPSNNSGEPWHQNPSSNNPGASFENRLKSLL